MEGLDDVELIACGDALADTKKAKMLVSADTVVLAENVEKTSRKQFVKTLDVIKAQKKEILGLIELIE